MMIFPILKQRIISKPEKNLLDFHHFSMEKNRILQGRLFRIRFLTEATQVAAFLVKKKKAFWPSLFCPG
jgi:hypothetical protein